MRLTLLVTTLTLAGCGAEVERCRDSTLLLAVTLDAASAKADTLEVALTIDGAAAMSTRLAHPTGQAGGNVLVQFPHGYPRSHIIGIGITALVKGVTVGSGAAMQLLTSSCEVTMLDVRAPSHAADMTLAPVADMGDMAGAIAVVDMAGPALDLHQPPDMVCVPTAETGNACFDGIDNDCDGKIDCADPDCTMGVCVPAPTAPFNVGVVVAEGGFCPALYVSEVVINSGISAVGGVDCPTTGCTCTGNKSCSAELNAYGQASCGGDGTENSATAKCGGFNSSGATIGLDYSAITVGLSSCDKAGSSTRSATQWAVSDRFCKTTVVGGGCGMNMVCIPNLAVQTCEVAMGNVACDTGYAASGGPWFTDPNDTRTCTCECGSPTGGTCGTTISIYTQANCQGAAAYNLTGGTSPNKQACSDGGNLQSLQITGGTLPTCAAPTTQLGGSLGGAGPYTLCCH